MGKQVKFIKVCSENLDIINAELRILIRRDYEERGGFRHNLFGVLSRVGNISDKPIEGKFLWGYHINSVDLPGDPDFDIDWLAKERTNRDFYKVGAKVLDGHYLLYSTKRWPGGQLFPFGIENVGDQGRADERLRNRSEKVARQYIDSPRSKGVIFDMRDLDKKAEKAIEGHPLFWRKTFLKGKF